MYHRFHKNIKQQKVFSTLIVKRNVSWASNQLIILISEGNHRRWVMAALLVLYLYNIFDYINTAFVRIGDFLKNIIVTINCPNYPLIAWNKFTFEISLTIINCIIFHHLVKCFSKSYHYFWWRFSLSLHRRCGSVPGVFEDLSALPSTTISLIPC